MTVAGSTTAAAAPGTAPSVTAVQTTAAATVSDLLIQVGDHLLEVAGVLLQQTGDAERDAIVSAVFVFLVSLLVGTVAIHAGARLLIDRDTGFRRAAITAVVGAVVYTVVGYFLGWIPFLGPVLMLLAWAGVINLQYPGGWPTAAAIGFVSWIAAILILFALATLGLVTPDAFGVPGT